MSLGLSNDFNAYCILDQTPKEHPRARTWSKSLCLGIPNLAVKDIQNFSVPYKLFTVLTEGGGGNSQNIDKPFQCLSGSRDIEFGLSCADLKNNYSHLERNLHLPFGVKGSIFYLKMLQYHNNYCDTSINAKMKYLILNIYK